MKFQLRIFLLFAFIFFCATTAALKAEKIAVVDMNLLVSMHPSMSLFDFDRMGFYKLPLGLTTEKWEEELKKQKRISSAKKHELEKQQTSLRKEKEKLDRQKSSIISKFHHITAKEGQKLQNQLTDIGDKDLQISKQLKELEYQINCPDLTSPAETRRKLAEIEAEVMHFLKKVAAEKGFRTVLNGSIPVPTSYELKYQTSEMYGIGIPGIDQSLFYAFLSDPAKQKVSETPSSWKVVHWMELTNFPKVQNYLPIKPYPLVILGGKRIEKPVLAAIYNKYKINKNVTKVVNSVLDTLEAYKKTYKAIKPDM